MGVGTFELLNHKTSFPNRLVNKKVYMKKVVYNTRDKCFKNFKNVKTKFLQGYSNLKYCDGKCNKIIRMLLTKYIID